ncbi:Retrovirus-related Pol polyprotein from transposon TNT 1-94, partial [Glycine soja]
TKFDVEKFTGKNNFNLWRVKMLALLTQQECELALEGEEMLPAEMTAAQKRVIMKKAYSAILLSLGDEVLGEVSGEKTADKLWAKLESRYMTKSLHNRLCLKKQLYTMQMHEGESIHKHIDNFNQVVLSLKNIDVAVDDEDQAVLLLSSLPRAYDNFVDTIIFGRSSLSMEEVKTALQSWELKRRITDSYGGTSSGEGLMVRGRMDERKSFQRRRSKSRSKNKNNNKCHNCQKEGHWKRNCPELKKDKVSTSEFGGAAVVSEESDGGNVLFVSSNVNDDDWILDSACTFHMTPNRDWFATFQNVDGGKVLMGNDGACSIAGKGTVQIKMNDGIVRTLTDVRY